MAEPKNKTVKSDIPDLMDQAAEWIERNARMFIFCFGLVSVGLLGFWVFSAVKSYSSNLSVTASGEVNLKIDVLKSALLEAKGNKEISESEEFKAKKKEELMKTHESVLSLLKEYPSSVSSYYTAVKWAKTLNDEELLKEAVETLDTLTLRKAERFAAVPALMKAAIMTRVEEFAQDASKVVSVYDMILETEGWAMFHGEALIQKASLLNSKGDKEAAIALLEKAREGALDLQQDEFTQQVRESQYKLDSRKYLRLLKFERAREGSTGS